MGDFCAYYGRGTFDNFSCFYRTLVIIHFPIDSENLKNFALGNTAQRLWCRCAVRFYGRLCINFAGILTYVKEFVCKMPENMRGRCAAKPSGGLCAVLP